MNASVSDSASATDSSGSGRPSVSTGSGSHGPMYCSRVTRADLRRSSASRVTTVIRYARGERTSVFPAADDRSHASCTTSSASDALPRDRKSTRLNSSHLGISYAVFSLKKKTSTVKAGLLSMLAIPVRVEGRLQAAGNFFSAEKSHFTNEDVLVGKRIADDVALAVSHPR